MAGKRVKKDAATKVARQRLSVLELAETLGSISEACRYDRWLKLEDCLWFLRTGPLDIYRRWLQCAGYDGSLTIFSLRNTRRVRLTAPLVCRR